jgi:hypothetical protein
MAPVSLSPLTQTYTLVPPRGLHVGARSSDGTSRCPSWRSLCDVAMARRIGASEPMRCVPHTVSAAIMTHIDQRRRHDCRAGRMLREVPSQVATTVAGNTRVRSLYLCKLYTNKKC